MRIKFHGCRRMVLGDNGWGAGRDRVCERRDAIACAAILALAGFEAGVDQVILITQTETIPHERAMQSIEMFGKHVIPACRTSARRAPVTAGA